MTLRPETRLTDAEKLIIWLLAEILKNQKDYGDKKRMELLQEVLYGGHLWALKQHHSFANILTDHVDSRTAVDFVYNTLDMWFFIEGAYKGFSAEEKKQVEDGIGSFGREPKFRGFDGNNESEYLGITQFIVEKLEQFEAFRGRDFDSHVPQVNTYEKMVALFEPIRVKLADRKLTPAEMITLLKMRL
jgi:uncharacterized protein YfbU (UPF0304 family)